MADLETKLKNKVTLDKKGCWIWVGAMWPEKGYGQIRLEGKLKRAHRVSYEHFTGKIPKGLEIDHLCSNKACINPAHLEAVSHKVNIHRSERSPCAKNKRKTHCKNGHPFSKENTYYYKKDNSRHCRICLRNYQKNYGK